MFIQYLHRLVCTSSTFKTHDAFAFSTTRDAEFYAKFAHFSSLKMASNRFLNGSCNFVVRNNAMIAEYQMLSELYFESFGSCCMRLRFYVLPIQSKESRDTPHTLRLHKRPDHRMMYCYTSLHKTFDV